MSREFTGLFLSEVPQSSSMAVTLEGPTAVYQTQSLSFKITNFDSYSSYTFTGPFVNIQRIEDIVNLTITRNATVGNTAFTVTKNDDSRTFRLMIAAAVITPPQVGSIGPVINDIRPTFNVSGFITSPAGIDTLVGTQWEISTDAQFQNLMWSKVVNSGDVNTVAVDEDLPTDVPLYLRARYIGASLGSGLWSIMSEFEIVGVAKPTVAISGAVFSADRITRSFALSGAAYDGPGTHSASRWRVLNAQGVVVHDSGEVTGSQLLNYTPINNGWTPTANTDYWVDVRYKSSTNIWSSVSLPVAANVADGRVTAFNTYFQRQTSVPYTQMVQRCTENPNPSYYHCHYIGGSDTQAVYVCDPNSPTPPSGGAVSAQRMTYVNDTLLAAQAYDQGFTIPMHYVSAQGLPPLCTIVPRITYNQTWTSVSEPASRYTEF
jgi:hypothetical protein